MRIFIYEGREKVDNVELRTSPPYFSRSPRQTRLRADEIVKMSTLVLSIVRYNTAPDVTSDLWSRYSLVF